MEKVAKKLDIVLVLLFPSIIFLSVFFLNVKINYLESLLLMFGVPSLYLSFKSRRKVAKVFLFSLLISIPVALIFELLGVGTQAWVIPHSVFSWRLFSFSPVENYVWQFLVVYTILIFYEYIRIGTFSQKLSKRVRWIWCVLYSLAFLLVFLYCIHPSLLAIPYAYIWPGIVLFVIPVFIFLYRNPSFFWPFLKVQVFFFYLHTLFELIGVKLHHWIYPGHYVGWVTFFGQGFPLEELIFVMLFGAFTACTYYEFFGNES